jgi:D-alanyl-D-alanine carboxypeptidase (penicillin-binding protein 5/6)
LFLSWCTYAHGFDTLAKSAIVFDETTNSVIFEKGADKAYPPASMSKLMTLLLAFEALEEGRIALETTFRVSAKASQKGGSKMFIEENQLVSVENLIRGITVASGNDACIALAEGLNGTEDSFVSRMNLKAKDLGLKNSNFNNSTGWPSPGHVMSARDLLILSMHLRNKYSKYYNYFQELSFSWNGIKQENRNPLLKLDIGVDGLKTGHTEEAGYGLVGSAKLGVRRINFVLTGMKTSQQRKIESEKIAKWAFRDFTVTSIFPKDYTVASASVWIGETDYVDLRTKGEVTILVPYGKKNELRAEAHVKTPLMTPIKVNDQIGILKIIAPSFIPGGRDRVIEYPLISGVQVNEASFVKKIQAAARMGILTALKFSIPSDIPN